MILINLSLTRGFVSIKLYFTYFTYPKSIYMPILYKNLIFILRQHKPNSTMDLYHRTIGFMVSFKKKTVVKMLILH